MLIFSILKLYNIEAKC